MRPDCSQCGALADIRTNDVAYCWDHFPGLASQQIAGGEPERRPPACAAPERDPHGAFPSPETETQ